MDKIKVLIAEDDAVTLKSFALVLEALGCEVTGQVTTGLKAVESVRAKRCDCVLMDVNMPVMDGMTAAKQIFNEFKIPTVIITGVKEHLSSALKQGSGVFGYIQKPADEYELNTVIGLAIQLCRESLSQQNRADAAEKKLEERKNVERAKGLLMDEFSMKEQQAMAYLQKKSRDTNMKLNDVARQVIARYDR